ncbi:hypothetical protein B0H63DRAFT_443684 [Podospora didyma]|uniref:Uncharacterized protein n=1 Tax=Podospora didyma TaxID=330526 RepID=A0AAE0P530_9PEZI|nr:hypothetical protein B0H63DRAFT_443684 [Podospora didyma]
MAYLLAEYIFILNLVDHTATPIILQQVKLQQSWDVASSRTTAPSSFYQPNFSNLWTSSHSSTFIIDPPAVSGSFSITAGDSVAEPVSGFTMESSILPSSPFAELAARNMPTDPNSSPPSHFYTWGETWKGAPPPVNPAAPSTSQEVVHVSPPKHDTLPEILTQAGFYTSPVFPPTGHAQTLTSSSSKRPTFSEANDLAYIKTPMKDPLPDILKAAGFYTSPDRPSTRHSTAFSETSDLSYIDTPWQAIDPALRDTPFAMSSSLGEHPQASRGQTVATFSEANDLGYIDTPQQDMNPLLRGRIFSVSPSLGRRPPTRRGKAPHSQTAATFSQANDLGYIDSPRQDLSSQLRGRRFAISPLLGERPPTRRGEPFPGQSAYAFKRKARDFDDDYLAGIVEERRNNMSKFVREYAGQRMASRSDLTLPETPTPSRQPRREIPQTPFRLPEQTQIHSRQPRPQTPFRLPEQTRIHSRQTQREIPQTPNRFRQRRREIPQTPFRLPEHRTPTTPKPQTRILTQDPFLTSVLQHSGSSDQATDDSSVLIPSEFKPQARIMPDDPFITSGLQQSGSQNQASDNSSVPSPSELERLRTLLYNAVNPVPPTLPQQAGSPVSPEQPTQPPTQPPAEQPEQPTIMKISSDSVKPTVIVISSGSLEYNSWFSSSSDQARRSVRSDAPSPSSPPQQPSVAQSVPPSSPERCSKSTISVVSLGPSEPGSYTVPANTPEQGSDGGSSNHGPARYDLYFAVQRVVMDQNEANYPCNRCSHASSTRSWAPTSSPTVSDAVLSSFTSSHTWYPSSPMRSQNDPADLLSGEPEVPGADIGHLMAVDSDQHGTCNTVSNHTEGNDPSFSSPRLPVFDEAAEADAWINGSIEGDGVGKATGEGYTPVSLPSYNGKAAAEFFEDGPGAPPPPPCLTTNSQKKAMADSTPPAALSDITGALHRSLLSKVEQIEEVLREYGVNAAQMIDDGTPSRARDARETKVAAGSITVRLAQLFMEGYHETEAYMDQL